MQHISQVVAPSPSSDRCDWLESAIACSAGVLRSCPGLTCVAVEYRVVNVHFDNRIEREIYQIVSSYSNNGTSQSHLPYEIDRYERDPNAVYDEEFAM